MNPIRKAVFPVSGWGSRFLPATKAMPKEMLPIVDRPLIQYAVEEAIKAGITELIFITGRTKRAIEDHFDASPELEKALQEQGKTALLEMITGIIPPHVHCIYIRQPSPLGLGHAVLCAEPVVGNESFAVILADDLIDSQVSVTQQLIQAAHEFNGSVLGTQAVPTEDIHRYGVIAGQHLTEQAMRVDHIVEKPTAQEAPSNIAVVGRYVFEPVIFEYLRHIPRGVNGEWQLTDAIAAMLADRPVYAFNYEGTRYDCGSKFGFLQANLELGRKYHGFPF